MNPLMALLFAGTVPPLMNLLWRRQVAVVKTTNDLRRQRQLRKTQPFAAFAIGATFAASWVLGALSANQIDHAAWTLAGSALFASVCLIVAWVSCGLTSVHGTSAGSLSAAWNVVRGSMTCAALIIVPSVSCAVVLMGTTSDGWSASSRAFSVSLTGIVTLYWIAPLLLGAMLDRPQRLAPKMAQWLEGQQRTAVLWPAWSADTIHVGWLRWIKTFVLTEGALSQLSTDELIALCSIEQFEEEQTPGAPTELGLAVLIAAIFILASVVGDDDIRRAIACLGVASGVGAMLMWLANRRRLSALDIAAVLRSTHPPALAAALNALSRPRLQWLPTTSRHPLPAELHKRLLALGYSPGPPPS